MGAIHVEIDPVETQKLRVLGGASLLMALAQSICAAVLAVSGIRVVIGLAALTASTIWLPVLRFHQTAIRVPMLTLATAGAVVNLAVLLWVWRLRALPSAKWRRRELSAKQKRSERLQFVLAVVTLLLVLLEVWTHDMLTRRAQARRAAQANRAALVEPGPSPMIGPALCSDRAHGPDDHAAAG